MSLLVTGSIGIDDVKSPEGEARGVYGGSAVYFSMAARLFAKVRFVGVVGEDFPPPFRAYLEQFGIDLAGLEVRPVSGPMTFAKAAVRNVPKLFWYLFPVLDTVAGLLVEGDPRQRFSDRILGTTVAQSSLIHVRLQRAEAPQ